FQSAGGRGRTMTSKGRDLESTIELGLDEIVRGGKKHVEFDVVEQGSGGGSVRKRKSIDVTIPAGVTDGSRIRLSGQGGQGLGGGPSGDLYLRVRLLPYPPFSVEGQNLSAQVDITPWQAALGGSIPVKTLETEVSVKIPAATRSGQTLRLRGKGLPKKSGDRGDILVSIRIVTPKKLTPRQKELYEALRDEEQ
ncbi:MAG: DnaJ C-terminal domain-containing protein, partial [Synergistota bacterium]|nr:DnaJ C-terminal domain-containing protein [Synergistota bacterium]